jgi:WD40 repeat protein
LEFGFNAPDAGVQFNWQAAAGRSAAAAAAADYDRPDDHVEDAEEDEDATSAAHGYTRCFTGHRNMLSGCNAAWLGSRGQHVVAGSDDGSLYVWAADSGELLTVLRGGDKAVRRVQVGDGPGVSLF